MAARRCSLCGISYPAIAQFVTCPIHGEPTDLAQNIEPDPNWKEAFQSAKSRAEKDAALNDRPFPLIPGVQVFESAYMVENKLLYVRQEDIYRAGARLSSVGLDQFYLFELEDGWVYETQGWDDAQRRWWVERVIPADAAADLDWDAEEELARVSAAA